MIGLTASSSRKTGRRSKRPRRARREHWPVPGTRTFLVLLPEFDRAWRAGEISVGDAEKQSRTKIRRLLARIMSRVHRRDRHLLEDLTQALIERLATMNALARYNPSKAKPETFLKGVARMIVREHFSRRPQPPVVFSSDAINAVGVDADPAKIAENRELIEKLQPYLDRLSKGELRALIDECGPLPGYSCPTGRRRRRVDRDALERAVQILRDFYDGER